MKERKTKKDRKKREFLLVLFNLSFTFCHKYTYMLTEKKRKKRQEKKRKDVHRLSSLTFCVTTRSDIKT